jgi:purine-nucleoside phosphorylase
MISSKQKQLFLEQLKKTPIVQVVCEKTSLSRSTYYRLRNDDEEFRKQADEALLEGLLLVNDLAESQLISAIKDKNLTGIIFWLRNHHKNYSDKININGKLEVEDKTLSVEQQVLIQKALQLAGLAEDNNSDNS